ncbi:hypothetical protein [Kribbella sp. NPDC051620]|uniref:hypothetical protein n=1 Tax=Kribbella sp. NPDC051620 TaxID=3364120 RepID=UPI003794E507
MGNCTFTKVAGAPYPGGDVTCATGQGYYRATVYCLSSRIGGREVRIYGNIIAVADMKHSRAFCTASYPILNEISYATQ